MSTYCYTVESDEGIVAYYSPKAGAWLPLVGLSTDRLRDLERLAEELSEESGKKLKIVRYKNPETIRVIEE